jgi:threonylcarbamoyladenosine tRNA methylthiotransferase MtaB
MSEGFLTKTITLRSIGCKTNQQEMMALGFQLLDQGYRLVDRIEEAEVVVVNTCSVTSATEAKTRRMLRQFSRRSPHIAICVAGCLSQQKAHEMKREPNVRWVVGNACKNDIPVILQNKNGGIFCETLTASHEPLRLPTASSIYMNSHHHTRFSIKIQEGCNFRCAYCIVPFLRGDSRSAPIEKIIAICNQAIETGYKEIVLTGTHIGQFRDERGEGLMALLDRLAVISGDFRVRLSSLDPRDLSPGIIDLIGTNPRFCQHLHLSVQSLSPAVLAAMNRPVSDMNSFIETLIGFRMRFTDAGIGGDFITGFPGETEAHFCETLENVEKIGFSYGHVFRYSKRPMTAAEGFTEQVDEEEKKRRSERLRAVLERSRVDFVRKLIGTRHRIIVEDENPVTGRAPNYLPIEVPDSSAPRNTWQTVMIDGMSKKDGHCTAALIDRGFS